MRFAFVAVLVVASTLITSAQSGLGALAGGAEASRGRRQSGTMRYRLIDGELARKLDSICAGTWLDSDEVLLIEYRSRTFLLRTNNPGNIGLACKLLP